MNERALSFRGPGAEPSYHYGPFLAMTFYESGLISLELLILQLREGTEVLEGLRFSPHSSFPICDMGSLHP